MNKKIFLLIFIFILTLFLIPNTYAYEFSPEEAKECQYKYDYEHYYPIFNFYATPNIDYQKTIKSIKDYLVWYGGAPYSTENNYMEIKDYNDSLILTAHIEGENTYQRIIKPTIIEPASPNAEYLIGLSNHDQIVIIVDGDTFKGEIADLVNDLINKDKTYDIAPEFHMDYESAAKAGGVLSITRYKENGIIYMKNCKYLVGFNLTKESIPAEQEPDIEDPAIYGGNEETKIDDTPTQKENIQKDNKTLKIVGISSASIISVLGIYVIYVLIKKIYQIMKG